MHHSVYLSGSFALATAALLQMCMSNEGALRAGLETEGCKTVIQLIAKVACLMPGVGPKKASQLIAR